MRPWVTVLCLSLLVSACATVSPQTAAYFKEQHPNIPSDKAIDVPYIKQRTHHCGPASLAMVMQWANVPVTAQQTAQMVMNPKKQGSLQVDMLSASRRYGLMAIPIKGFEATIQELAAGHPVIIFENLSVGWAPVWHFAVVHGYDLRNRKFLLHTGPYQNRWQDMADVELSWKAADYWGLVVLPPDQLAASADELAHVTAAAGLEQTGFIENAEVAYKEILERWPESLMAQIGLANVAFARKEYGMAVNTLTQATVDHPEAAVAWHNLAIAEQANQRPNEAHRSARIALKLAPEEAKASYRKSLKNLLE